jgi:hypothetical protein
VKTQFVVALFLLGLGARVAHAQAGASVGSGAPTTEVKQEGPPRFYGLGLDFALFDGTGLNAVNYNNSLSMYFVPTWAAGHYFDPMRRTRFSTFTVSLRFALTRPLAGYDDANYSEYSDNGYAVRCSNLAPSSSGTVDPNQVRRCQYDSNFRWDPGDLWLSFSNPKIYQIPYALIDINPGVRLVFPTSLESRYQTMRLSATALLGASRRLLGDKLKFGYTFGFTKYFHEWTTPGESPDGAPLRDQLVTNGYEFSDIAPNTNSFLADPSRVGTIGGYNPDFGFTHYFTVDYAPTEKWSISLLYLLFDTFAYPAHLNNVGVGVGDTTNVEANCRTVSQGPCGRGHKDTQVLWITVGYQVTDYLGLSLSWINWAPLRYPDNSYRQGVISTDYNAFTQVNFGATLSIEKLAGKFL